MYTDFYRLSTTPFRLTPDPKFFFASSGHSRGLAYLRYGLQQGQGFVVITGVPGTGKSMLIQALLAELSKQKVTVATIANTNLEPDDVLRAVADAFGVRVSGVSKADYITTLERFFRAQAQQGRHVLLVVDEAQNLPRRSLEELRMLSNFQDGNRLLVQTVLIGQQQLRRILADPSLEQLTQRVIAACHLKPISAEETRGYIEYRMRAAGWVGEPSFSGDALVLIYRATGGNPRLINILGDRLLLAAYLAERRDIDVGLVESVLAEFDAEAGGAWNGRGLLDAEGVPAMEPLPGPNDIFENQSSGAAPDLEPAAGPYDAVADEPVAFVADVAENYSVDESDDAESFAANIEEPPPEVAESSLDEVRLDKVDEQPRRVASNDVIDEDGFYTDDAPEFTPPPQKRWGKAAWGSIASTIVLCAMGSYLIVSEDFGGRVASVVPTPAPSNVVKPSEAETVALAKDVAADAAGDDVPLQRPPAPIVLEQELVPVSEQSVADVKKPLPEAKALPAMEVVKPSANSEPKPVPAPKPVPKQAPKPESRLEAPKLQPVVQKTQLAKVETKPVATPVTKPKPPAVPSDVSPEVAEAKVAKSSPSKPQLQDDGISLYAATDLAHGFALAYEEGDLQYFPKMFSSDAEADGTHGIVNIMRDYQELFQATMMRNMVLSDFEWNFEKDIAQGVGMFEVSVWEDVQATPSVVRGVIELELIRSQGDQRLLIRNLSHKPH